MPITTISIIIPAYNEEQRLGPSLEHLAWARADLATAGMSMELIVSDDGSTDGTVEIARSLADKVVTPVPGDRVGPGAARNRGAAEANGELLVFLDADIRPLEPARFLTRAAQAMEQGALAGATCRLAVHPAQARPLERLFHLAQDRVIWLENLIGIHTAGGWCQMVPRQLFEQIGGYREDLMVSQDVDLFLRLGKLGPTRLLLDLTVHESPHRYRDKGLLRTYLTRLANSIAVTFGGTPKASGYRDQRPERHG